MQLWVFALLHAITVIAGDSLDVVKPISSKSSLVSLTTSSTSSATSTASSAAAASATPLPIDCTDVSKSTNASCWDILGMNEWMFNWNFTTKTCNRTEIWSNCFLREADGTAGNDCSKLGSVSCPAPALATQPIDAHTFYGAYNIYGERCNDSQRLNIKAKAIVVPAAVEQYLSVWQTAIYAIGSQPAINNLVSTLSGAGPKITVEALLAAIVQGFGLDQSIDEAFVSILPSGRKSTPLDVSVAYMSTQLGALLAQMLLDLSTDFYNGYFLLLAQHGQLMTYTGESLQRLEASLANIVPASASTAELGPISNRRRGFA